MILQAHGECGGSGISPNPCDYRRARTLALELELCRGKQVSEKLLRHDLIVMDELGYLPFSFKFGVKR
jgi:hypothetical protein